MFRFASSYRHHIGQSRRALAVFTVVGVVSASASFCSNKKSECAKRKLLTPIQCADVANIVQEKFSVPLIPSSIQLILIQRAVNALVTELEDRTDVEDSKLAILLGQSLDAGITDELVEKICDELASSLANEKLPMLGVKEQRELLEVVVRTILSPECRPLGVATVHKASRGLDSLLDTEGRSRLVKQLNDKIDIPFLNEDQEAVFFGMVLDSVAKCIKIVIPGDILAVLDGSNQLELKNFKSYATNEVLSRLPFFPGVSVDLQKTLISTVVDILFDALIEGSAIHEVAESFSSSGRINFLRDKEVRLLAEKDLALRAYRRRDTNLQRDLLSVKKEIKSLEGASYAFMALYATTAFTIGGIIGLASYYR